MIDLCCQIANRYYSLVKCCIVSAESCIKLDILARDPDAFPLFTILPIIDLRDGRSLFRMATSMTARRLYVSGLVDSVEKENEKCINT